MTTEDPLDKISQKAYNTRKLSLEEARLFKTKLQFAALDLGVPKELALQFKTDLQYKALVLGISAEQALKFTTRLQHKALKLNVSSEIALQFKTDLQYEALVLGATPELALDFKTDIQMRAFKLLGNEALALKFSQDTQIEVLEFDEELGKEALEFHNPNAVTAYKTNIVSVKQALQVWSTEQVKCLHDLMDKNPQNPFDIDESLINQCVGITSETTEL